MNFDWQTEQDRQDVWEEEQETAADDGRSPRRRRWWLLLVVAALVLLSGFLLRREAQERVDEATATVEEDVVSSHSLGLQAAQARDSELFTTLLSGREPSWTETQKALLEAGLLYDDAVRLFGLQPAGEPHVADVSFAPDLKAAELKMAQRYTAAVLSTTEAVTLEQTLIYREGEQRWLLSPPEAEFWGSWESVTDGALTVDYPVRDEEIARRLAGDLTEMLAEMCATLEELECTAGWWMRLRLEKDPESVLDLGAAEAGAPAGTEISLPSPSLVGIPAGDAAYQALLRGYARHLVAAAIGDLVGWECCVDGTLYYQALLYEQLAQLGLRRQPAPLRDYVYLIDEGLNDALYGDANDFWLSSRPAPPEEDVPLVVHAMLAFLRDEGLVPQTVAMQRSLSQGGAPSLLRWIERWIDPPAPTVAELRAQLTTGFQTFARRQMQRVSEAAELPDGLSLPRQDLLLACGGSDRGGFDLYRYDLAAGDLTLEADLGTGYVQLTGGNPNGIVAVLAYNEGDEEFVLQNLLWHPSGEIVTVAGPDVPGSDRVWLPLSSGPGGELAVLLYSLPVEESQPTAGVVDLQSCGQGGCAYETLPGLPLWSPSGTHLLALDVFQEGILLQLRSDGDTAWQEVGRAWAPVWLDDEVFAYVPYSDQLRLGSVWAAPADGGEAQRLVPAEDLTAALPAGLGGRQVVISWVLPHPLDENQLLVGARSQSGGGQLLFSAERAAGISWLDAPLTVSFIEHFPEANTFEWLGGWYGALDFVSPDGRWLLLPLGSSESGDAGIRLYDLLHEEAALRSRSGSVGGGLLGQAHSWTRDGQWLARPLAGMIDVIAPGFQDEGRPYRRLIAHDFEGCAQAVWVDRK